MKKNNERSALKHFLHRLVYNTIINKFEKRLGSSFNKKIFQKVKH